MTIWLAISLITTALSLAAWGLGETKSSSICGIVSIVTGIIALVVNFWFTLTVFAVTNGLTFIAMFIYYRWIEKEAQVQVTRWLGQGR